MGITAHPERITASMRLPSRGISNSRYRYPSTPCRASLRMEIDSCQAPRWARSTSKLLELVRIPSRAAGDSWRNTGIGIPRYADARARSGGVSGVSTQGIYRKSSLGNGDEAPTSPKPLYPPFLSGIGQQRSSILFGRQAILITCASHLSFAFRCCILSDENVPTIAMPTEELSKHVTLLH